MEAARGSPMGGCGIQLAGTRLHFGRGWFCRCCGGPSRWTSEPAGGAIDGYAGQVSALPGKTVERKVSVPSEARYRVGVFRLGDRAGEVGEAERGTPCVSSLQRRFSDSTLGLHKRRDGLSETIEQLSVGQQRHHDCHL